MTILLCKAPRIRHIKIKEFMHIKVGPEIVITHAHRPQLAFFLHDLSESVKSLSHPWPRLVIPGVIRDHISCDNNQLWPLPSNNVFQNSLCSLVPLILLAEVEISELHYFECSLVSETKIVI